VINPSDHQDAIIQKYKELEQDQRTEEGGTIYELSRNIDQTQSPEEKALFASQAIAILQRQLNEDHFLSDQKRKSKESLVKLFSHHIKKNKVESPK
jgi:quinol monooxygenase YgiN